jgi:hypothetical protein
VLGASFSLLTPVASLVGVAALVPVAAALAGRARAESVRRRLALPPPGSRSRAFRLVGLTCAVLLLALAAAQPALTRESRRQVRRDVQALFVIDTSRSMAASAAPGAPTRLARATVAAARLRGAIRDVESGVATLTDRVLPDLLPVADESGFDAVVARTVAVESPPPRATAVRATSFGALGAIPDSGFFAASAVNRVVVLLTDGETVPTDTAAVARAFGARPGYTLVAVRFWHANEAVYSAEGRLERAYRPDPTGKPALAALADATTGRAFEEDRLGPATTFLRKTVGTGPTVAATGTARSRTTLAPYVAALALLVLAAIVRPPRLPSAAL